MERLLLPGRPLQSELVGLEELLLRSERLRLLLQAQGEQQLQGGAGRNGGVSRLEDSHIIHISPPPKGEAGKYAKSRKEEVSVYG